MTLQGQGWCLDLAWRHRRELGPAGTSWRPRLYWVRALDFVAQRRHGRRRYLLVAGLALGPVRVLLIR